MAGRRDPEANRADQERHRAKRDAELTAYRLVMPELLNALKTANEAPGGKPTLGARWPDDPIECAREMAQRLTGCRLVLFRGRKRQAAPQDEVE